MLSLADLRARNVTITWQEAVAVVQELAATVAASGSAERFPDLQHIALIPNGDVVPLPGSPAVADPVRHVAVLLATLVERTSAPPELTAFVKRATAVPPPFAALDELTRALAFFERPGRRGEVERLVARAMATHAHAVADQELRRIKQRPSGTPGRAAAYAAPRRRRWRAPLAVGLAVLAVATAVSLRVVRQRTPHETAAPTAPAPKAPAATAALRPVAPQPGPPGGSPPSAVTVPAPVPSPPQGSAPASLTPAPSASLVPSPTAVRVSPAPVAPAAKGPAAGVRHDAGAPRRAAVAAPPPAPPAVRMVEPHASSRPTAAETAPAPAPRAQGVEPAGADEPAAATGGTPVAVATNESTARIYTADDAGVTPPMLVRPMLPAEPPLTVPDDQVGTLELVIDEAGNVEQVKLSSPANRYQERMIVASAKSWKFKPARRDGRPVKYRTRLRVTI